LEHLLPLLEGEQVDVGLLHHLEEGDLEVMDGQDSMEYHTYQK